MARPKKTGLDYFPHDSDASSDEKMEPLEALFGNDGYAVYFKLLERIYRAGGALDMASPDMMVTLAKKCNLAHDRHRFEQIFFKCLSLGLFDVKIFDQKKLLTSTGIKKRVKAVMGKRLKNRTKKDVVSEAETPQKLDSKTAIRGEIKGNKIKEKEIKEEEKETIPRAPVSEVQLSGIPGQLPRHEIPRHSKGTPELEEAFRAFWNAYPARNGKKLEEQETFRRFCMVSVEDWSQVILAAEHYAKSEQVRDGVGIKDPKNFLGNQVSERGFWREWVEGENASSADESKFAFLDKVEGAEL